MRSEGSQLIPFGGGAKNIPCDVAATGPRHQNLLKRVHSESCVFLPICMAELQKTVALKIDARLVVDPHLTATDCRPQFVTVLHFLVYPNGSYLFLLWA